MNKFKIILAILLITAMGFIPAQAQGKADPPVFTDLRDFDFTSANQGWVLLDNRLFRTTDGGQTWTDITPSGPAPGAVAFVDQDGWVVLTQQDESGVTYTLAATHNAGANWELQPLTLFPADEQWVVPKEIRISFSDPQNGVIVIQHAASANFNVQSSFKTKDGGASWKIQSLAETSPPVEKTADTPANTNIVKLDMVTGESGWAKFVSASCQSADADKSRVDCASETRLQRTTDSGQTWQTVPLPSIPNGVIQSRSTFESQNNKRNIPGQSVAYTETMTGQGFDTCEIPTASELQMWWKDSPYKVVNLYIGGSSRACSNARLSESFLDQVHLQGWKFIPTWVGLQAPCSSFPSRLPYDTSAAYNQGISEADAAALAASKLGLTAPNQSGTIIYYDMEAYDTSNTACRNAVNSFIAGWTAQMETLGNVSALYGASCATALTDIAKLPNPPDAIWIANWIYSSYNSGASVWDAYCLSNSYWPDHQRLRQYAGGQDEIWGGLTLNIDSDVLDGVVAIPNEDLTQDDFGNVFPLPSAPVMDTVSIGAATTASDDPNLPCGADTGYNTVWYKFTPSASGTLLINTTGSDYDTILAVWTGGRGALTSQACSDNFNGNQSEVQFEAASGTPYYIEVASRALINAGKLALSVYMPAQDDMDAAQILHDAPDQVSLDTTHAGESSDDPAVPLCNLAPGLNTVWFKLTPIATGPLSFDTFTSSYDTALAVWSGARGNLSLAACNDDSGNGRQSQVEATLTAGQTYYVEVSQFNRNLTPPAAVQALGGGTLNLHVTSFFDVPGNYWAWTWIETLAHAKVTGGCGSSPKIYCPDDPVTRAQMAVFLLRGIHGSSYAPPAATGTKFGDVPANYWAAAWIEELAKEGITGGCGSGNFCPEDPVTRAQMAVFLLKSKHGATYSPPPATGIFNDVPPTYWAAAWIEQLANEGITSGCSAKHYCPDDSVTRAQMAVFLDRTFNLTNP